MPYIPPASLEPQPLPIPSAAQKQHDQPPSSEAGPSSPHHSESDGSTISPHSEEANSQPQASASTGQLSLSRPSNLGGQIPTDTASAEQVSADPSMQASRSSETPRQPRTMSDCMNEPLPAGPSTASPPQIDHLTDALAAVSTTEPRRESHDSIASTGTAASSLGDAPSISTESVDSIDSEQDEMLSTPATSVAGASLLGLDEAVVRYREGLYAYTRNLYLEAKLSSKKTEKKKELPASSSFGVKQSGMERLAAKKALAKRLNA